MKVEWQKCICALPSETTTKKPPFNYFIWFGVRLWSIERYANVNFSDKKIDRFSDLENSKFMYVPSVSMIVCHWFNNFMNINWTRTKSSFEKEQNSCNSIHDRYIVCEFSFNFNAK